jgi:hypothetical protein
MPAQDFETLAMATLSVLARRGVPFTRPGFQEPEYNSRSLLSTIVRPAIVALGWQTLLVVNGKQGYIGLLKRYIAGMLEDPSLHNIRWRLVRIGRQASGTEIPQFVERHKPNGGFPLIPKETHVPFLAQESVAIQYRNLGVTTPRLYALLGGWFFAAKDETAFTSEVNTVPDVAPTDYQP